MGLIFEELLACLNDTISNFCATNNKLIIEIIQGENQKIVLEEFDYCYDYRIDYPEFIDHCITIVFKKSENKELFGKATIIVIDEKLSHLSYLWYKNDDRNCLQKISLYEYCKGHTKDWITLGYTQTSKLEKKTSNIYYILIAVKFYVYFLDNILKKLQAAFFLEVSGYGEYQEPENIEISLDHPKVKGILGKVNKESTSSQKIAKLFGMKQNDQLYNFATLGPVYMHRQG